MGDVLGEDQGVEVGALVHGVPMVGFELVKGDDLPDGEEEEEAGEDEGHNVAEGSKCERHWFRSNWY